jgi:RHS repeat-associated protein
MQPYLRNNSFSASTFGSGVISRAFACGEYRYGFNGQEKDDEIYGEGNSYTAEFWQYDSRLGRRWNVDPVVKHWESSYATFANNPIFFIDPNGDNAGDFYNKDGQHLGSDGIDDDKVYVADDVTKNDKGLVTGSTNSQELNMTHSEFQKTANIVKHESSGNQTESLWIAHAANNAKDVKAVGGVHSNMYQQLTTSGYSSVSSTVKNTPLGVTDNSNSANYARAGVINVLMGGADPTGGAVLWDGTDFLTKGVNHNKFKEAVSITMTGSHFSAYQSGVESYMPKLTTHSSFSQSNVYLPSNAPNGPVTIPDGSITFRNDYGWMGGNFYGQGKGKYYHYSTTGGQGASLFWKITPK